MESVEKKDLVGKVDLVLVGLAGFLLVAAPLLVVPDLTDPFDVPKQAIVLLVATIGILLWLGTTFLGRKPAIVRSPFDSPILLIVGVSLASALISPNRVMAILADPVILGGAAAMFFLMANIARTEKIIGLLVKIFLGVGAILGIMAIIQTAYTLAAPVLKLALNYFLLSPNFSLTGSLLTQTMLLVVLLPLGVGFYRSRKSLLVAVLIGAIGMGALAGLFNLYQNRPILLPFDSGWKIATGVMGQSLQSAILGMGPANFIDAFTAFKPIEFNNSPYWNLRFTTSSNYYYYVLSTLGIAGLAAVIFLIHRFGNLAKKRLEAEVAGDLEKGLLFSIGLIFIGFLFLPGPGLVLFVLLAMMGMLVANYHVADVRFYAREDDRILEASGWRLGLLAVTIGILIAGGYFLGRSLLADYFFGQSLVAAAANRGADTYNLQIKAIQTNPGNDIYHANYAMTNLALANSLASQANLSDQQKQTVVQLVQQAIREGRVAAGLAPFRSGDYENLSLIYRNLINFAQGADQWAVASEQQAIALDPTNPRLRLDLGGIYLALQDYQSAGQIFAQAVNLKPDYANAHYNLAQALKQLKLNDQAAQQLQATATLVCVVNPQSNDCKTVNAEIANLSSPVSATPSGQLQSASPSAQALPKAATKPPAKIASPGGELQPAASPSPNLWAPTTLMRPCKSGRSIFDQNQANEKGVLADPFLKPSCLLSSFH